MVFFKDKKSITILILTVLTGLILRIINANTRTVFGDPPHFDIFAINFLNSGLLVTWDQSTFLWFALTDIFYKIFGVTQFASRFSSVLFGTLTIIAIYLFTKEFSNNNKIALISAIIYAFAPTFVFNAADEHDVSVLFFIIISFYCLIKGLKNNSKPYLIISGIFFGVACMWKAYVPLLIIPYLGFAYYYHRKNLFNLHKNWKTLIWIFTIIFLLVSPVLVYNYLNYKHNDVPTFFFIKFFKGLDNKKIGELYGWVSGGEIFKKGFSLERIFFPTGDNLQNPSELYIGITYSLYSNGHILTISALIGLIFMFFKRKKDNFVKDYLIFFLLYFIIPFLFLIDSNYLSKHFIQFIAFSIPIIAYMSYELYNYINSKFNISGFLKRHIYKIFVFILLFEFFVVLSLPFNGEIFFSPNSENDLLHYKQVNIPERSFIIYDYRIYNSLAGWLFNDRYYIPTMAFNEFMQYNEKSQNKVNVPVYIIECVPDSCGWAVNEDLNKTSEMFFDQVKNQSGSMVHVVPSKLTLLEYYNPFISKDKPGETFKIYKLNMDIDLELAKQIKKGYNYFLYPLRYENKEDSTFKNFIYKPEGLFEKSLDNFAWFIFYLDIFLSFFAIAFILFEFYMQTKTETINKEIA